MKNEKIIKYYIMRLFKIIINYFYSKYKKNYGKAATTIIALIMQYNTKFWVSILKNYQDGRSRVNYGNP